MTVLSIRRLVAAASLAAAALYLLIGFEVVTISADATATSDIFAFGALMAAVYAGLAILLWRSLSRLTLLVVGLVQVVTIVGYVAVSSVRTPPYEPVGLTIKVLQLAILIGITYLVVARPRVLAAGTRPRA
jgi:hypothetical protein